MKSKPSFIEFLIEFDDTPDMNIDQESKADMIKRQRDERMYKDAMTDNDPNNDKVVMQKRARAIQMKMNDSQTPPEQRRALRMQYQQIMDKMRQM